MSHSYTYSNECVYRKCCNAFLSFHYIIIMIYFIDRLDLIAYGIKAIPGTADKEIVSADHSVVLTTETANQ